MARHCVWPSHRGNLGISAAISRAARARLPAIRMLARAFRPLAGCAAPGRDRSCPGWSAWACWPRRSACSWRPGPAVLRLGDLPEVVALLHRVHLGFGGGLGGLELVVHLGHAHGVAQRQRDLLGGFGIGGGAADRDLVAVDRDLQSIGVQAVLVQFLLQLVDGGGLGFAGTEEFSPTSLMKLSRPIVIPLSMLLLRWEKSDGWQGARPVYRLRAASGIITRALAGRRGVNV